MTLLDTNVLAELTKPTPDARVKQWLDGLDTSSLWICSITVAEILLGVALLPDGKRKPQVVAAAQATFQDLAGLCVAFDGLAAVEFAKVVSSRRSRGRPISYADAQIAAIALSAQLTLATRNTEDFSDIEGLALVDPWAA